MPNNFADLFEHSVDAMPERVAVVQGERRVRFGDLENRANQLAHHLDSAGIGAGAHVGFQMHNSVETLETLIACFKLRAVPININYRYGSGGTALRFRQRRPGGAGASSLLRARDRGGPRVGALDPVCARRRGRSGRCGAGLHLDAI